MAGDEAALVQISAIPPGAIGASWGEDDTIVIGTGFSSGLWRVSANGGEPEELTAVEDARFNHLWPHFLPDASALLFTIMDTEARTGQIALLDLDTH